MTIRAISDDGTDTLYNVEKARFAGGVEVFLNNVNPTGAAVISDTTPTQGFALSADTDSIDDPNGTTTSVFSYQWQSRPNDLAPWVAIAGATLATFTPPANSEALVGQQLRVVVTFTDDQGTVETVESAATAILGDNYLGTNANNNLASAPRAPTSRSGSAASTTSPVSAATTSSTAASPTTFSTAATATTR